MCSKLESVKSVPEKSCYCSMGKTRKLQAKEKEKTNVEIPKRLLDSMKWVSKLISSNDERATTPSDDLIQSPDLFGGLLDEETSIFGFTYFPESSSGKYWELELSSDEIYQIAKGRKKNLDFWRCKTVDCNNLLYSPKGVCIKCDYGEQ